MNRTVIILVAVIALVSLLSVGLRSAYKAAYQAGYDASESVSTALREATLRANAKVAADAAARLSFNLGKAAALDERAEQIVMEIESHEEPVVPGVCGISADRMRQLEAIR